MSRRISARLREEAAVACAQMATWWTNPGSSVLCAPMEAVLAEVRSLAMAAFCATPTELRAPVRLSSPFRVWCDHYATAWAEAEALLRTGWSP